jgi:hypothetical protein
MKSHPVAFCAYAPTNVIIQSGRGEHRTADQLEDDCDISIITHNISSELKETYVPAVSNWGQVARPCNGAAAGGQCGSPGGGSQSPHSAPSRQVAR